MIFYLFNFGRKYVKMINVFVVRMKCNKKQRLLDLFFFFCRMAHATKLVLVTILNSKGKNMFLGLLNQEEKLAFLEIAHHFAWSNNNFSNAQKEIIAAYCLEMQVSDISYNESEFSLKNTLAKFKDKTHQKIVLLETMALAMADNITTLEALHKGEKEVLETMIKEFGLSNELAVVYADWTKAMLILTDQGKNLISL